MTATITRVDAKLAIRTEGGSFEENRERCKAIGGARWHPGTKTWRYPLSIDTCHDARTAFGDELVIDPAVAA